jgi:hypothetical protein
MSPFCLYNFASKLLANTVVGEPEGSTPLIPKTVVGQDPEPVLSTAILAEILQTHSDSE